MTKRIAVIALALLAVIAGPACSQEKDKKEELGEIIDRTERLARAFVYEDRATARTEVTGVIEDDFRYKARLTVAGVPIEDEVVADDALAARFLTPEALSGFVNEGATASATVVGALRSRRWVLDEVGAPATTRTATDRRQQGDDQVFDAITALGHVTEAIDRALAVEKYSEDDVSPVYRENEDPFDKPKAGSRTERYDVRPPRLPAAASAASSDTIPDSVHFRKMVIYVRDGRVLEVREQIDVESKLDDLIDIFNLPKETTAEEAIFAINGVRKGLGRPPIRLRQMVLQLSRFDEPLKADLPADVIKGSLSLLKFRGPQRQVQQPAA